jgi:steroid delta-isomerase-like uncharacterized protein
MARDESTDVVKNYYAAFNRKDWDAMLNLVSESVVHDMNQGNRAVGKSAFARFLSHMAECYDEVLSDIVVFSGGSRRVAAEFIVRGRYLRTDGDFPPARGQNYALPAGAFFEVGDDGRIERVTTYYNLSAWIKMVSS